MNPAAPVVAIVDDESSVCRSVARLLVAHDCRVQAFTSGRAYLAARERRFDPTCLISDIAMPELDGLALQREARARGVDVPTIFITGTGDVTAAVRAMRDGAADLLAKPFDEAALVSAVESAARRGIEQATARRTLVEMWRQLQQLTRREAQVCALVASGWLNKQIAAALGVVEKTVKVHRARMMQKLGTQSVADLVRVVDHVLAASAAGIVLRDGARILRPPLALDVLTTVLGQVPRASTAPRPGPARAGGMDQEPMPSAVPEP